MYTKEFFSRGILRKGNEYVTIQECMRAYGRNLYGWVFFGGILRRRVLRGRVKGGGIFRRGFFWEAIIKTSFCKCRKVISSGRYNNFVNTEFGEVLMDWGFNISANFFKFRGWVVNFRVNVCIDEFEIIHFNQLSSCYGTLMMVVLLIVLVLKVYCYC